MGFSEINHKINMKVKKDCQVIISPLLQSMLGFRQTIFPAGEYASDWVADIKKGLNSLYVYCSLVEPRMVGDAQVPLLRIVPVEGRDGEMITRGSKDSRTRGFKNGIKYCRRCRTRKKYQTGSKITIEINRRKLTP